MSTKSALGLKCSLILMICAAVAVSSNGQTPSETKGFLPVPQKAALPTTGVKLEPQGVSAGVQKIITSFPLFHLTIDSTDPNPALKGGLLIVHYTLSNPRNTPLSGRITATFQGQALTLPTHGAPPEFTLAPHSSQTGTLITAAPLQVRTSKLALFYSTGCAIQAAELGKPPLVKCNVTPGPTAEIIVDKDDDADGLSDRIESQMLAKYTPYLRFSLSGGPEDYRPADVLSYVRASELQNDGDEGKGVIVTNATLVTTPAMLLSQGSNLLNNPTFRKDRFLNPLGDDPRHGAPWTTVLATHNVGLYGHVVPFKNVSPQGGSARCPPRTDGQDLPGCALDATKDFIKVEYWQFFGYNDTGQIGDIADHESDWCSVQLFIEPQTGRIAEVDMFFHGKKFGYYTGASGEQTTDLENGQVRQLSHGPIGDLNFTWNSGPVADTENQTSGVLSQTRVLRLYRDPISGDYVHPVVYIEHGSHEFWPTENWSFAQAPNHNGDDAAHSYLAAPPPNLGEVEYPLQDTPAATLILQYNGHWGAFNHDNSPPQGPPLHRQWQLPAAPTNLQFGQTSY